MADLATRIAALTPEQRQRLLQELARRQEGARATAADGDGIATAAADGRDRFPLSPAQRRLWLLDRMTPGSLAYTIPLHLRLRGALDRTALGAALDLVVARHASLRTAFVEEHGEPIQKILPAQAVPLPVTDLGDLDPAARAAAFERLTAAQARRSFDLARPPLIEAHLARLGPDQHVLLLTMHHIVWDGWSNAVFLDELAAAYPALAAGRRPELPALPIQVADAALWQEARLRRDGAAHEDYWRRRLDGLAPTVLPTDRPPPPVQDFRGALLPLTLPADLRDGLQAIARRTGASLYMVLLAGFLAWLHRTTGQTDLAVGTAFANRNHPQTERLIGFFVNTLVLRADLSGRPGFTALVEQVRRTALEAFEHAELPFDRLVEALRPSRDHGGNPLARVAMALQPAPASVDRLGDLEIAVTGIDGGTTRFDLELVLWDRPDGLSGGLVYATALFDAATAGRMAGHLRTLLTAAAADPTTAVDDLPLLDEAERRLAIDADRPVAAEAPVPPLPALVADWAARQPEATALVWDGGTLSYGTLASRAETLARRLIARGIAPDQPVGVLLERSPEAMVALLGIMAAGGAYLPLDPDYPAERIAWMLEDAAPAVVLTRRGLRDRLPEGMPALCLDGREETAPASPLPRLQPDGLAYIVYTSGSTGRPKGVMATHRGLANVTAAERDLFGTGPGCRVAQFAPLSFDGSILEAIMALGAGATLVLAPADDDGRRLDLTATLRTHAVTHAFMAPSMLAALDPAALPDLRVVMVGGEACPDGLLTRWADGRRLFNGYGPTETTVFCMLEPFGGEDGRPPIGRTIANLRAYVLDPALRPVPVGLPGELYIAGLGIVRGYWRRPDLTAERFLPDPFGPPGTRMYRTGDQVRRRADGRIDFLGRFDHQLKIRGFRVEPGEIEAALERHPAVREAVVTGWRDPAGDLRLVAYVLLRAGVAAVATDAAALKAHLAETLPAHLLPQAIVIPESLPRTPNGKIDRQALPAPDADAGRAPSTAAPRTPTERLVAEVWVDLLHLDAVGTDDSFFDLGGHSLLLLRLQAALRQRTGRDLAVARLIAAPTVAAMARLIDDADRRAARALPGVVVPLQPRGRKRPFFCVHPAIGSPVCYLDLARRLDPERPFYGIQAVGIADDRPPFRDIEAMARHYAGAIRQVQPDGPYLIGGWSLGATIAYEVARALRQSGQPVGLVLMIDGGLPPEHRGGRVIGTLLGAVMTAASVVVELGRAMPRSFDDIVDLGQMLGVARPPSAGPARQGPGWRERLAYVAGMARTLIGFQPAFTAVVRAFIGFRPKPLDGDVVLVRALGRDAPVPESDPILAALRSRVRGGVAVHAFPATHMTLLNRVNTPQLALRLRSIIDAADTTGD